MDKLIKILETIKDDVDYANCESLVDDGIFDSFDIIQVITELEEHYDVVIAPEYINASNFNSAKSILSMILEIKNKS